MQLAVALYNNNVDDDDELEFRKGDMLTVLVENPNGLDGWWLCKKNGKCGLCPENRLRLIPNTVSSSIKFNNSRLSTASMYDDLSSNSTNQMTISSSSSSNHDYDNSQGSDFISNSKSPESSSRSSGVYSANDHHLSSSSFEFYTSTVNSNLLSSIDIDQLKNCFQKLSIRSLLIEKYRQVILQTNIDSTIRSFITECQLFLHTYGYLLDRYTYKVIKQNFLYEIEYTRKQRIDLSTKILQLIKTVLELRLKQKSNSISFIPNDVFRKLHLEPICEEIPNEKSLSTTEIYGNFLHKNHRSQMTSSKTCHSNFFHSFNKSDDYDYIDHDDYEVNPLIKCYYRHVHEQIDLILKRYKLLGHNENKLALIIIEGKALVVAGHKLVFVLETLREHLKQIQTSLILLTTQLCEALTTLIQLLKQLSHQNCTNSQKLIIQFKQDTKKIINIVQRIKQQCILD